MLKSSIKCKNCGKVIKNKLLLKFCDINCKTAFNENSNKDYFSKINSPDKAYWLGLICADGWLDKRDSAVGLQLKSTDSELVKKFAKTFNVKCLLFSSINSYLKNGVKVKYRLETARAMVYSRKIFSDLNKIGISPRKTFTDMSVVFNFIPQKYYRDFIRGYFDGDGSIFKTGKNNRYKKGYCGGFSIVGQKRILEKIRDIIYNNSDVSFSKIYRHKMIFSLFWRGDKNSISLFNYLYKNATLFLKRKHSLFKEIYENASL